MRNFFNPWAALGAKRFVLVVIGLLFCFGGITCFPVSLLGQGLTLNFTVHPASCTGDSDGSIWLGVSGGTAPYQFEWESGENTQDIVGLSAGTYQVTVTDADGNLVEGSIEVAEPDALQVSVQETGVSCPGLRDGTADASASGGVAPYHFKWSTGVIAPSISDLAPGEYSVTVTDAKGCMAQQAFTIGEPDPVEVRTETIPAECGDAEMPGNPDQSPVPGTIAAIPSGGTPPYAYRWNTGQATATIEGVEAGNYKVTVTDANGCRDVKKVELALASSLEVTLSITHPTHCEEETADGTASVTVTGGTTPYLINWSTGETGTGISGLAKGNYSVTVTDAVGCAIRRTFKLDGRRGLFIHVDAEDIPCADVTAGKLCGMRNRSSRP